MEKLIEALQIFLRYRNEDYPTGAEHDILLIRSVTKKEVSKADKKRLKELNFHWDEEYESWASYKYG